LLNLAKGAKLPVYPKNVNAILKESVELFEKKHTGLNVLMELSDTLWMVDINKVQIEQVLLNILENALDAMRGQGKLTIATRNVALTEQQVKPYRLSAGNYVEISIRDTGVGMDRKTMEKIFDPFFTTKKRGAERGSGLGLATVYTTIKNHAGMIKVHSEVGKGATFAIYLPASKTGKNREAVRREKEVKKGAGSILIIDDEEMVLDVGSLMIRELGYRVFVAKSGKEGCEIYSKHSDEIDLVILDLNMPDMNGEEVFNELKKTAEDCKVLLSSGYEQEGDAERILDLGCRGFIQKPFNLRKLSESIHSAMGR
jgi:CheY-like chemotaxis protein